MQEYFQRQFWDHANSLKINIADKWTRIGRRTMTGWSEDIEIVDTKGKFENILTTLSRWSNSALSCHAAAFINWLEVEPTTSAIQLALQCRSMQY